MVIVIIVSGIMVLSLGGLVFLAAKKIPALLAFPVKDKRETMREMSLRVKEEMGKSKALKHVTSPDLLLQKALSKGRVATLKTEQKMGLWLEDLRKKSQVKQTKQFGDSYWNKLKKKQEGPKRPKVT
jgi:hypothetical protein